LTDTLTMNSEQRTQISAVVCVLLHVDIVVMFPIVQLSLFWGNDKKEMAGNTVQFLTRNKSYFA